MAYDEDLAARVRDLLEGQPGVTEKRMFGGLAFLLGGNMAVAANSKGGLMLRCDPEEGEALAAREGAHLMEMGGRVNRGWVHYDPWVVADYDELEALVARGVDYAGSLPAKQPK
ncbi:MAG: TfoX/Sxy family protein [Micrococcales bacterium]|nr:TfoX/Sxy family protein [Micrococcales bacterium]